MNAPTQPAWQKTSLVQKVLANRLIWPTLALLALLAFNAIFTPGFFNIELRDGHLFGSLIDILSNGAPIALLAIGMTLVIATGGVDLSVGSVMAIAGAVAALLIVNFGWPFVPAMLVALALSIVLGVWNGVLVSALKIQPIIATLILMVSGRGLAQLITSDQKINFTDSAYKFLGNGFLFGLPFGVTLVAIVFAVVAIATRKTALGLAIESIGDSPSASRYVGLRVKTIQISAYAICALCAGMAGLVTASRTTTADPINDGVMRELDAIFAVVVGGTALAGGRFTLVGSLIGAVLLQAMTTTLYAQRVPPEVLPLPKAIVIVVVCLLQSSKFRSMVFAPFAKKGVR